MTIGIAESITGAESVTLNLPLALSVSDSISIVDLGIFPAEFLTLSVSDTITNIDILSVATTRFPTHSSIGRWNIPHLSTGLWGIPHESTGWWKETT